MYILYRIFSQDGALLYVGATTNPATRINDHSRAQPWWDEASDINLQRFATMEGLCEAEVEAIKTELPRYNVIHTDKPPVWSRKPRGRRGEGSLYRRANGLWVGRVELPPVDGKRRYRSVSSIDRREAQVKLAQLKADVCRRPIVCAWECTVTHGTASDLCPH